MAKPTRPRSNAAQVTELSKRAIAESRLFGISSDFPQLMEINVCDIAPNPNQPRKHFDEEKIKELAVSIDREGLIQPIIVRNAPERGKYILVAGERRWRAHQVLEKETIYAVVRDGSPETVALIENIQREDLNPFELADGLKLLADKHDYTTRDLGDIIGRSAMEVSRVLSMLNLPEQIRAEYPQYADAIYKSALVMIAGEGDSTTQLMMWDAAKGGAKLKEIKEVQSGATRQQSPKAALDVARKAVRAISKKVIAVEIAAKDIGADEIEELKKIRDRINALIESL